jgi:DNA-binding response OmpR family regulator
MEELLALIDTNSREWIELGPTLEQQNYRTHYVESTEMIENLLQETGCRVVILDLDLLAVDNRFFRSLKRARPHLSILALSSRTFHPELQEAMASHICACLHKPADPDELIFWIKAVTGLESRPGYRTDSP